MSNWLGRLFRRKEWVFFVVQVDIPVDRNRLKKVTYYPGRNGIIINAFPPQDLSLIRRFCRRSNSNSMYLVRVEKTEDKNPCLVGRVIDDSIEFIRVYRVWRNY